LRDELGETDTAGDVLLGIIRSFLSEPV